MGNSAFFIGKCSALRWTALACVVRKISAGISNDEGVGRSALRRKMPYAIRCGRVVHDSRGLGSRKRRFRNRVWCNRQALLQVGLSVVWIVRTMGWRAELGRLGERRHQVSDCLFGHRTVMGAVSTATRRQACIGVVLQGRSCRHQAE